MPETDTSKLPIIRINNLDVDLSNINNSIELTNQNLSQITTDLSTSINNTNLNVSQLDTKTDTINSNLTSLITALTQRVTTLEARRYVSEAWSQGTEWYRVWSDGWIEQGGYMYETGGTAGVIYTKTLYKPYATNNYTILMWAGVGNSGWQYCAGVGLGTGGNAMNLRENNVTNNSFTYFDATGVSGTPVFWYACGY